MGLQTAPAYISQTGFNHPAELFRNLTKSIFGRSGLVRFGDFAITPTGTNRQISIAKGSAVVLGSENATQGAYYAWSDAAELKTFGTPSGSPRIDTLLLRIADPQYGTIPGSPMATWDIVQGVPAGSPTARVDADFNSGGSFYIPGAWFRVADVRIETTDQVIPGGNITPNLKYVRGSSRKYLALAAENITDATWGDERQDTDTGLRYWWNGTVWRLVPGQLIATNVRTAGSQTIAAGSLLIVQSITLNVIANQPYLVTWESRANTTVAANGHILSFRAASGASVTTTSPGVDQGPRGFTVGAASQPNHTSHSGIWTPASSGQFTVGILWNFFSGSGTTTVFGDNSTDCGILRVFSAN
jgi:hypothetical protein